MQTEILFKIQIANAFENELEIKKEIHPSLLSPSLFGLLGPASPPTFPPPSSLSPATDMRGPPISFFSFPNWSLRTPTPRPAPHSPRLLSPTPRPFWGAPVPEPHSLSSFPSHSTHSLARTRTARPPPEPWLAAHRLDEPSHPAPHCCPWWARHSPHSLPHPSPRDLVYSSALAVSSNGPFIAPPRTTAETAFSGRAKTWNALALISSLSRCSRFGKRCPVVS